MNGSQTNRKNSLQERNGKHLPLKLNNLVNDGDLLIYSHVWPALAKLSPLSLVHDDVLRTDRVVFVCIPCIDFGRWDIKDAARL